MDKFDRSNKFNAKTPRRHGSMRIQSHVQQERQCLDIRVNHVRARQYELRKQTRRGDDGSIVRSQHILKGPGVALERNEDIFKRGTQKTPHAHHSTVDHNHTAHNHTQHTHTTSEEGWGTLVSERANARLCPDGERGRASLTKRKE
jgi:hypothetical protein